MDYVSSPKVKFRNQVFVDSEKKNETKFWITSLGQNIF